MIIASPFPPVTIPEIPLTDYVLQNASRYPGKPALIDGPSGRTLTYGQLAGAIRLVAGGLHQRGFKKGDVCAIYSPNIPEYAIIFHAVAMLGGINTTVNPLYTAEELLFQLNDARAKFLITIPLFLEKAQAAAAQSNVEEIFVFGEAEGATPFAALMRSGGEVPAVEIDVHKDLVVLPYSSGTTGLPKGVMLTHHNLVANMAQVEGVPVEILRIRPDDVLMGLLPFYHIYGMLVILNYSLAQGATVVSVPRFDLEQFLQVVQEYKLTIIHLVPPVLLALAKHPIVDKYDLSRLRFINSGAAPLGRELAQAAAQRLGCYVVQGYGLTETSPVSHFGVDPTKDDISSVGSPIPNTECLIVNVESGQPVERGSLGEVWIRGPQVMQGYLNNPQATAHTVDAEGWLRTGDIGYADEKSFFYIVDRLKELIKYKGYQVAPAELEGLLLSHPAIADAAVIPSPDEEAGEVPKAFVVKRGELSGEDVMAFIAKQVAPHKKVRLVEFVDAIPKSASGKILRRVLVERERTALL